MLEDDFSGIVPGMEQGKTLLLDDEQAYHFVHGRTGVGGVYRSCKTEDGHFYRKKGGCYWGRGI